LYLSSLSETPQKLQLCSWQFSVLRFFVKWQKSFGRVFMNSIKAAIKRINKHFRFSSTSNYYKSQTPHCFRHSKGQHAQ